MKKNILRLIATAAVSTLIVGCGGGGDDEIDYMGENDNDSISMVTIADLVNTGGYKLTMVFDESSKREYYFCKDISGLSYTDQTLDYVAYATGIGEYVPWESQPSIGAGSLTIDGDILQFHTINGYPEGSPEVLADQPYAGYLEEWSIYDYTNDYGSGSINILSISPYDCSAAQPF